MNRSQLLRASAVLALYAVPVIALAPQERAKRYFVAMAIQGDAPAPGAKPGSFRREMLARGYVEGRNLVLDVRGVGGDNSKFPSLVRELLALKPDVLVAETTPGALAAKQATSTVPIVMWNVSDPIGTGLVTSLAHPGGNVTGSADAGIEIGLKSIELLLTVVPRARTIAVLMSDNPVHPIQLHAIESAATPYELRVLPFHVLSENQAEGVFNDMVAQRVDAFISLGGAPLGSTDRQDKLFAILAAKAAIPGVYASRGPEGSGKLMSYGMKTGVGGKLTATYVADILDGGHPADMPVQRPREVELFINMKTAASLGLIVPPALVLQADYVQY